MTLKFFSYIQYFFFLAFNWNWNIAFHIISHEIKGEKKYGIDTTGSDALKSTAAQGIDITHANVYMPANYRLLEEVFANLPPGTRRHFLDIGCGKGRALCMAAHNGFDKVTGVDFSSALCKHAIDNLQRTAMHFPSLDYKVNNCDATGFEIAPDTDCIFFFNPFDEVTMAEVARNIRRSLENHPREMIIIYLNPLYKSEFSTMGFKQVFHTIRMKYMEAVILRRWVS